MIETQNGGPLFTDLYELAMAAGYFAHKIDSTATFSLYIRESAQRNFFVAAGLEDVLNELERRANRHGSRDSMTAACLLSSHKFASANNSAGSKKKKRRKIRRNRRGV